MSLGVKTEKFMGSCSLGKKVNLMLIHYKQSSWIQTNTTTEQSHGDTSPNKISEYYLP